MKKVVLWIVILLGAFGAGFAVAAATYEPPDPRFDEPVAVSPSFTPSSPPSSAPTSG